MAIASIFGIGFRPALTLPFQPRGAQAGGHNVYSIVACPVEQGLLRLVSGRANRPCVAERSHQNLCRWLQSLFTKAREFLSQIVVGVRTFVARHIFVENRQAYKVLGLKPGATQRQIKDATFAAHKKHSRAVYRGDKEANDKLAAANSAYASLTKKNKPKS